MPCNKEGRDGCSQGTGWDINGQWHCDKHFVLAPRDEVRTLLLPLRDAYNPETYPPAGVKVEFEPQGISIAIEGYGESSAIPGHGRPILVEQLRGTIYVKVWSDINEEDPLYNINMACARESARRDPEPESELSTEPRYFFCDGCSNRAVSSDRDIDAEDGNTPYCSDCDQDMIECSHVAYVAWAGPPQVAEVSEEVFHDHDSNDEDDE
jgi:hypothetical protein